MRDEEYQQLTRALDEQLHADLELIQAGYRAKRHALDMLWRAAASPEDSRLPPAATSSETQAVAETQPPARSTLVFGSIEEELDAIFPGLPEVFDKEDVLRALPFVPHRATLHRALESLLFTKCRIVIADRGRGRRPTRYRKVSVSR